MPPFNVTLLLFGALLVLLGLVGKLDVKDIRFGTDHPRTRVASGVLGVFFVVLALLDNSGILKPISQDNTIDTQTATTQLEPSSRQNTEPIFLVVTSTQFFAEAKSDADELIEKGYEVTVYKSKNDFFAVTIESLSKPDAEAMLERLKQLGLIREDSHLSDGSRWTEKIYP
ncbi:hypothetical protein H6G00_29895 [Leptolyngbya sp. FACHB-541]|uniref:hypothetical protein n=1 Tax=Leptolyngbya sp. FACHB-541 TaxID=2692810 RepID=UPI0016871954|nr:hypothetical protein [Leptolyngbya sp. FACHB-541]MBD2000773.1 hypothetical protein [Leptolyngbya sp. FACHB-541]